MLRALIFALLVSITVAFRSARFSPYFKSVLGVKPVVQAKKLSLRERMAQRTIRLMSTTDDGFDDVCKDTPKSSVRKRYGTWPWPPGIHTNGISSAYVVSREPGVYDPVDCPCGPNCECEVCTCAPCCACHLRESCGCGYKPWRTRYFSTTSPKWLYLTDELIEEWDKAKLMSESSTSSSR